MRESTFRVAGASFSQIFHEERLLIHVDLPSRARRAGRPRAVSGCPRRRSIGEQTSKVKRRGRSRSILAARAVRRGRSTSWPSESPIQLHVGNALQWLGTLYRNPADALKEHVSNAIDEHVKARLAGSAHERCRVMFTLNRRAVTVDYPYAMTRREFETALQRVADSASAPAAPRPSGASASASSASSRSAGRAPSTAARPPPPRRSRWS